MKILKIFFILLFSIYSISFWAEIKDWCKDSINTSQYSLLSSNLTKNILLIWDNLHTKILNKTDSDKKIYFRKIIKILNKILKKPWLSPKNKQIVFLFYSYINCKSESIVLIDKLLKELDYPEWIDRWIKFYFNNFIWRDPIKTEIINWKDEFNKIKTSWKTVEQSRFEIKKKIKNLEISKNYKKNNLYVLDMDKDEIIKTTNEKWLYWLSGESAWQVANKICFLMWFNAWAWDFAIWKNYELPVIKFDGDISYVEKNTTCKTTYCIEYLECKWERNWGSIKEFNWWAKLKANWEDTRVFKKEFFLNELKWWLFSWLKRWIYTPNQVAWKYCNDKWYMTFLNYVTAFDSKASRLNYYKDWDTNWMQKKYDKLEWYSKYLSQCDRNRCIVEIECSK